MWVEVICLCYIKTGGLQGTKQGDVHFHYSVRYIFTFIHLFLMPTGAFAKPRSKTPRKAAN